MKSKIEGVFIFLKEVLERGEFRIRYIEGIKRLITMAYVVGAYSYEIGGMGSKVWNL